MRFLLHIPWSPLSTDAATRKNCVQLCRAREAPGGMGAQEDTCVLQELMFGSGLQPHTGKDNFRSI